MNAVAYDLVKGVNALLKLKSDAVVEFDAGDELDFLNALAERTRGLEGAYCYLVRDAHSKIGEKSNVAALLAQFVEGKKHALARSALERSRYVGELIVPRPTDDATRFLREKKFHTLVHELCARREVTLESTDVLHAVHRLADKGGTTRELSKLELMNRVSNLEHVLTVKMARTIKRYAEAADILSNGSNRHVRFLLVGEALLRALGANVSDQEYETFLTTLTNTLTSKEFYYQRTKTIPTYIGEQPKAPSAEQPLVPAKVRQPSTVVRKKRKLQSPDEPVSLSRDKKIKYEKKKKNYVLQKRLESYLMWRKKTFDRKTDEKNAKEKRMLFAKRKIVDFLFRGDPSRLVFKKRRKTGEWKQVDYSIKLDRMHEVFEKLVSDEAPFRVRPHYDEGEGFIDDDHGLELGTAVSDAEIAGESEEEGEEEEDDAIGNIEQEHYVSLMAKTRRDDTEQADEYKEEDVVAHEPLFDIEEDEPSVTAGRESITEEEEEDDESEMKVAKDFYCLTYPDSRRESVCEDNAAMEAQPTLTGTPKNFALDYDTVEVSSSSKLERAIRNSSEPDHTSRLAVYTKIPLVDPVPFSDTSNWHELVTLANLNYKFFVEYDEANKYKELYDKLVRHSRPSRIGLLYTSQVESLLLHLKSASAFFVPPKNLKSAELALMLVLAKEYDKSIDTHFMVHQLSDYLKDTFRSGAKVCVLPKWITPDLVGVAYNLNREYGMTIVVPQ